MVAVDTQAPFSGRVVVGADGSPNSDRAVDWAADYARTHEAPLAVVRVTPSMPIPTRTSVYRAMKYGPNFADHVWDQAQHELDAAVQKARVAHAGVAVTGELVKGETAAELSEISRDARLLVLGATGASAVSRMLLGGHVAAVVHHARGPVVIVPDLPQPGAGPVVVGLDDSPSSDLVASAALREAEAARTGLVAVFTWEVGALFAASSATPAAIAEVDGVYAELLSEMTASAEAGGVEVTRLVRHGRAENVLVDLSADASLLVVGSRGQGGFPGLLLGSVSRSVIARAACPVLVVRNVASGADQLVI